VRHGKHNPKGNSRPAAGVPSQDEIRDGPVRPIPTRPHPGHDSFSFRDETHSGRWGGPPTSRRLLAQVGGESQGKRTRTVKSAGSTAVRMRTATGQCKTDADGGMLAGVMM